MHKFRCHQVLKFVLGVSSTIHFRNIREDAFINPHHIINLQNSVLFPLLKLLDPTISNSESCGKFSSGEWVFVNSFELGEFASEFPVHPKAQLLPRYVGSENYG